MSTASKIGPQDLPPVGGYGPIQTERTVLRRVIGFKAGIAIWAVSSIIGWTAYALNYRQVKRDMIEMRSARFAMTPLLQAEKERAFLKQIRKNRDEEEDLMKDYPGWEVGTYFGEPIYHTIPEDTFIVPQFNEYTVHAPADGTHMLRHFHRLLV